MSMKSIQSPYDPIKPCEDSDQHQVGNLTLKFKRWNQIAEKLITPGFDIIDSVLIDHLPNFCSLLILSNKEDKIGFISLRKLLQMKSLIITSGHTHTQG